MFIICQFRNVMYEDTGVKDHALTMKLGESLDKLNIVIGDVGPYCGPSGVAATVCVDARFQGTIVRGLGYPSCRPSPCGPRRQFDIGDSCVRSKKQLQLFGSCIYIFILISITIVTI